MSRLRQQLSIFLAKYLKTVILKCYENCFFTCISHVLFTIIRLQNTSRSFQIENLPINITQSLRRKLNQILSSFPFFLLKNATHENITLKTVHCKINPSKSKETFCNLCWLPRSRKNLQRLLKGINEISNSFY